MEKVVSKKTKHRMTLNQLQKLGEEELLISKLNAFYVFQNHVSLTRVNSITSNGKSCSKNNNAQNEEELLNSKLNAYCENESQRKTILFGVLSVDRLKMDRSFL